MSIETEYALLESSTATVDANGMAQTILFPKNPGERWEVGRMASSCTSSSSSRLSVYRNTISDQTKIDFTARANSDISDNQPAHIFQQGEVMYFVWTGATVGSIATIRIEGKRYVPGKRAYT